MCSSCRQRGPGPSRAVVSWGGGGSALSPLGPAGGRCCRETTHSIPSPPQHPTLSRLPHPTLSHPTLSPTARPTRVSLCLPGGTGLPSPMAVLTHTHTYECTCTHPGTHVPVRSHSPCTHTTTQTPKHAGGCAHTQAHSLLPMHSHVNVQPPPTHAHPCMLVHANSFAHTHAAFPPAPAQRSQPSLPWLAPRVGHACVLLRRVCRRVCTDMQPVHTRTCRMCVHRHRGACMMRQVCAHIEYVCTRVPVHVQVPGVCTHPCWRWECHAPCVRTPMQDACAPTCRVCACL